MFTSKLIVSLALCLSGIASGYVIKVDNHNGPLKNYEVRSSNLTAEEFLASPQPVHFKREEKLDERQCGVFFNYYYELVGDGNPHQNYKIAQVEDTLITCSPGASIATGKEHTFSWSVSAGLSGVGEFSFASVGFSVGESDTKTVQQTFSCSAGTDMTEICAIHYTAVTAVTVHFYRTQSVCGIDQTDDLGEGVVYLPNANGVGSTIARGTNFAKRNIIQCRGQAAREMDFLCGPKGGPEWFDTKQYGPFSEDYMSQAEPAGCAIPIEAFQFND